MLSRYPSISFACISSYLPNKVVAGCAPDEEEDAELIPLLANRPTRDGRVIAYAHQRLKYNAPWSFGCRPRRARNQRSR